jgi:hypothetical protein
MTPKENAQLTYEALMKRKKEREKKKEDDFMGVTMDNHRRIQKRCRRNYR